jgi:NADH-quinone oxidoreductase subunit C
MTPNAPEPNLDAAQPVSPTGAPAPAAPVLPKPAVAAVSPSPAPAQPAPAPAPVLPNPLPHLPLPLKGVDYAAKGYHADATVTPDQVVFAAEQLDKEGMSLDTITGVDWMAEGQIEVVYDYFHPAKALRVVVRTRIPRDNPEIATIHKVFPGANWHERETHDFFGVRFVGHPNLTPFLLPEDADYHPLRKDFAQC